MQHVRKTAKPSLEPSPFASCPGDTLRAILCHLYDPVSPADAAFFASTCKDARALAWDALTELKVDVHAVRSFYKVVCRANNVTKLSKLSSLTHFDAMNLLANNHLAQQGLWIACARGALPKLVQLSLDGNQIGDTGVTALADACAMGSMKQLTHLDLSINKISDLGLASLSEALASGALPNLKDLLLSNNQIGDSGVSALADACAKGATASLKDICLMANRISDNGFSTLLPLLKQDGKLCTLTGLSIGSFLTDQSMNRFSDLMADGAAPQLCDLWLANNQIGDVGLRRFADACARGGLSALKVLCMHEGPFGTEHPELRMACEARDIELCSTDEAF